MQEVTKLLVDGADQLQATAYTTGAGSTEPTGIITALAGGGSEINGGGSEAPHEQAGGRHPGHSSAGRALLSPELAPPQPSSR